MALVQKHLQSNNDLSKYHIKTATHSKYPNLMLVKYSQGKSPFTEDIVCESRGVILDKNDNWKIVCYPYNKFFNYNEQYGKKAFEKLLEGNVTIYEKVDGSIMTLYYYNGEWHVSSSGRPDANGFCGKQNITFADLFWKVWNELGYELPTETDKCFMFELLTPMNQVIVPQKENRIVFHGVRDLNTLQEESPLNYTKYNWELIQVHDYENIHDAVERGKLIEGGEGYVICNNNFDRVKVKSDEYLKLTYMGKSLTSKNALINVVQKGEQDEYLSRFPEQTLRLKSVEDQYKELIKKVESGNNSMSVRYKTLMERGIITSAEEWLSTSSPKKLSKYINLPRVRKARCNQRNPNNSHTKHDILESKE